jgi:peptidoglycan/LPS O-acetylase OafA/YrhL
VRSAILLTNEVATLAAVTPARVIHAGARFTPTRIDQIDVLRGLSILAVLACHINVLVPLAPSSVGQHMPAWLVTGITTNGINGVRIFFAVSGFLITTNCLRRWQFLDQISISKFYFLRFARIAPMLLALLLVLTILHLLHVPGFTIDPHVSSLPRALLSALTFHVNLLQARHGDLPLNWNVLWSLSVEEVFYLGLPLVCCLIKGRRGIVFMFLVFVVLGPFARTVFAGHNEVWEDKSYLSCMDAISIGCLAAMASSVMTVGRRLRLGFVVVGWSLIAFTTLFRTQARYLGLMDSGLNVTGLALGTAMLAIASAHAKRPGLRCLAPVRWFGRNSYEVYLTHAMAIFVLLPLVKEVDPKAHWIPLSYLLMMASSGLLGWCIARFYSEPMNRALRQRLQWHMSEPKPMSGAESRRAALGQDRNASAVPREIRPSDADKWRHPAAPDADLSAELKRGLAYVRRRKPSK